MKKRFRWLRKKNIIIYVIVFIILVFPVLVSFLYTLPLPCIINSKIGDLLAYYGASFGILASFLIYRQDKKEAKKEKIQKFKPCITIDVEKKNEVFVIKMNTYSVLASIEFFDKHIPDSMDKKYVINACFCKKADEYNNLKKEIPNLINVILDDDIIDIDGYPKYLLISCDNVNGETWAFTFEKIKNENDVFYTPEPDYIDMRGI